MYSYSSGGILHVLQLVIIIGFFVPAILFLLTQHKTLEAIRWENRLMQPGQVWLQLIPLFGLVWQFIVINKIADSLHKELNAPVEDSIFGGYAAPTGERPTYSIGIAYAICFCCSIIPILGGLAALGGIVCWIIYWSQLAQFKRKVQEQSMSFKNTL